MAVDAITFSVIKGAENVNGKLLEQFVDATFSSSYPVAGYSFPYALNTQYGQLGIRALLAVYDIAYNTAGLAYNVAWDKTLGKLHVFVNGTEVTANTNLTTITIRLKISGTR